MSTPSLPSPAIIAANVRAALAEDIGEGDINAALIPASTTATARVITRQSGVFCGRAWADETLRQIDATLEAQWQCEDGDRIAANDVLLHLRGKARSILSAERTVLNFLQLLSGTATGAQQLAERVTGTAVRLLDTRKTLPGLRHAQKYAVACGGCHNHRMGLFDAYLIKENHIAACGGIAAAVQQARAAHPNLPVEVEVETLDELQQAIDGGAHRAMLDNFSLDQTRQAVALTGRRIELEASGNVTGDRLPELAATGVDYISIGALTKDVTALDLSLRLGILSEQGVATE